MGRDLVTHPLALSFYASNRDGALASAAPARHFPAHESNNGSAAYSATCFERRPCSPCDTALLNSSAACGDCSGKEQRTLCNGGTCMTKANSWRGPPHQPTAKPISSSCYRAIQNKNQSRRRTFCLEVQRKKMSDPEEDPPGPSAQNSPFTPVDSDQFQIGTLND